MRRPIAAVGAVLCVGCASTPVATPTPRPEAQYQLDIDAPAGLRELLQQHLDLARFQASDTPLGRVELQRLIHATRGQVQALLETEGYFSAEAQVDSDGEARHLKLHVTPGPRTQVAAVDLGLQSSEADTADPTLLATLRKAWPLKEGEAFSQSRWAEGKTALLLRARAHGYPLARWSETRADIDPEQRQARLHLQLDSGPLARLGELRIEGLQLQSRHTVERLAGFQPGEAYSEQLLLEFQDRLVKTQLFDSVRVQLLPDEAHPEAMPVQVQLREAPRQQATTSVGYHANTGQRIGLEVLSRKPLDLPLRARAKLDIGRDLRTAELELSSHPQPDLHRTIGSLQLEQDRSGDQITTSLGLRLGRLREAARDERLTYGELLRSREELAGTVHTSTAVSLNQQWIRRRLDSALLPTDGTQGLLLVGAGAAGDGSRRGGFGRWQLKLGAYQPLGAQWWGSGRLELGQVLAPGSLSIPEKLLWRAGGDDSVRGYAYQTLGPHRLVNGQDSVVGGHVLATASLEAAHAIAPSQPNLLGAVFIDAGNAAEHWSDYRPVVGWGAGLRWRSPVGPLRIDLARAQETGRWRLHFSVGIPL